MNSRIRALTALSAVCMLMGCSETPDGFYGNVGNAGGTGTTGPGPGPGTAGSLGLADLIYAEPPGNTGFDNVAMNGAGNVAVFMMSTDPLGTNPGGEEQLFSVVFGIPTPIQLTSGSGGGFRTTDDFDIDGAGAAVVFVSDQDITGDNPTNTLNLFLAATGGNAVSQVTSLTSGTIGDPGISGDGATIVFTSSGDLTGGNPMNYTQIFSIAPDGSGLTQVTTGVNAPEEVAISDNGSKLVWVDTSDPFGSNADGSREIFAMNIDGTNHMQLTMSAGDSTSPRISDDGAYIVFTSAAEFTAGSNPDAKLEVYVVNSDGTGLVRITDTDRDSGLKFNSTTPAVDISGDGQWITFMSYADLVGRNSSGTYTVFWANRQGGQIQQLLREETKPDGVSNLAAQVPRMSDDGNTILFSALAAYSLNSTDSGWKIFAHSRL